jgi:Protein of unknown function (DUF4058)
MPIHIRENQYLGVNPHLNSHFQQREGWEGFHVEHLVFMREAIQSLLPPQYYVVSEQSLQLSVLDPLEGKLRTSDLGIYSSVQAPALVGLAEQTATPTGVFALAETLVEPEHFSGIVIYHAKDSESLGRPITRIELLSPSNKPPGSHTEQYQVKRTATLESGIHMVEIDYLHEQKSALEIIPQYMRRQTGATPYNILVNIAQPSVEAGRTLRYGFNVDELIPKIPVPLLEMTITLDLNAVYQRTFAANTVFGMRLVNYEALPLGFESYSVQDQERIHKRMTEIQRQATG